MGMLVKATRAFFHVGDVSQRLAIEAAEKLDMGREGERERGREGERERGREGDMNRGLIWYEVGAGRGVRFWWEEGLLG